MKNPFVQGDIKIYSKIVSADEIAAFDSGTVHDLYSTFAAAKDAEWSTRLFVLEMKEADEEGIGTFINIEHHSPAFTGTKIDFYARLDEVKGHEIICSFTAKSGDRLIASGRTGQKILKRKKIEDLLNALNDV